MGIAIGGAVLFLAGLLLSLFRERLLELPEKMRRREGVLRVLTWRQGVVMGRMGRVRHQGH